MTRSCSGRGPSRCGGCSSTLSRSTRVTTDRRTCSERPSTARPAAEPRSWSANFGVVAAIQLHDVGVVADPWLGDVAVLAAVRLHDREAESGDQLPQVPQPAHAGDRDSYGGGEYRAAEQREPADNVSQYDHDQSGQQ